MLADIVKIALITLAPILFWGYFFYSKDAKEPEPLRFMIQSFFYGCFAALFLILVQFLIKIGIASLSFSFSHFFSTFIAIIIFFVLLGFVEEYLKHVAVAKMVHDHHIRFHQIIDSVEYSVAAALGFAFIENVYYFAAGFFGNGGVLFSTTFLGIFIFRNLGTVLVHVISSGIFGYFFALSRVARKIVYSRSQYPLHHFHRHFHKALLFRVFRKHVWKDQPAKHRFDPGILLTEGVLMAGIYHSLFNLFNITKIYGFSLVYLNVPLILIGIWYLMRIFQNRVNQEILK